MAKITVYMSDDEVWLLEQYRLDLRRAGVPVDRSALVRAAITTAVNHEGDWLDAIKEGAAA